MIINKFRIQLIFLSLMKDSISMHKYKLLLPFRQTGHVFGFGILDLCC